MECTKCSFMSARSRPSLTSYAETLRALGERARTIRLGLNHTQRELSHHAGVGLATVRRFEATGRASIDNVLRLATALRVDGAFEQLFKRPAFTSIDDALAAQSRRPKERVRARPRA